MYHYLEEHAPYLIDLIHKEDHKKQAALICEVNDMFSYFESHLMDLFSDAGYYQLYPLWQHMSSLFVRWFLHITSPGEESHWSTHTTICKQGQAEIQPPWISLSSVSHLPSARDDQWSHSVSIFLVWHLLTLTHSNRTKKRILSGEIKVTAQKNLAFLYNSNISGKHFNSLNSVSRFMCRYLVKYISTICSLFNVLILS